MKVGIKKYSHFVAIVPLLLLFTASYTSYFSSFGEYVVIGCKSRWYFVFVSFVSVSISLIHSIRSGKFTIDSDFQLDDFQNLMSSIIDTLSNPLPFVGSAVIIKIFLLAKFDENAKYLAELNSAESWSMFLIALWVFIKSTLKLVEQAKSLDPRLQIVERIEQEENSSEP